VFLFSRETSRAAIVVRVFGDLIQSLLGLRDVGVVTMQWAPNFCDALGYFVDIRVLYAQSYNSFIAA
jgi:hypothetical protein